jgi:xanthine dehydrogenase YagS FAD-binding subunit
MIVFPTDRDALLQIGATRSIRAGGTDLQDRRHLGLASGPLADLRDLDDLDTIAVQAGALQLGSRVRIATLASDPQILEKWPVLAAAAGGLATPQIRNVATLGGNLLQSVRCWYFRRPGARCFQAGGNTCDARNGDHSQHACIDLGPCLAPHPSTLAVALLAHDAEVEIAGAATAEVWPLAKLFGDGSDPHGAHRLPRGAVLLSALVPAPLANERAAFQRTSSRARGDWPIAEAVVRVVVTDGAIRFARVVVGGVANVPLRLAAIEQRLLAQPPTPALLLDACGLIGQGTRSPPGAAHKLEILRATVHTALERALAPADPKDRP